MIVAAFPRPIADRELVEQLVAAIERLAQLEQVAFATQFDPELLAHRARAAVAADQIVGAQRFSLSARSLHLHRDASLVLIERQELVSVAQRDTWQRLDLLFEQRFERVLRNQLIGLERLRAVIMRLDRRPRLVDRGVMLAQQRGFIHRQDNKDIHRDVRAQARGADLVRNSKAAEDLHGAGVAALHLGQELRRFLLLDQNAANAAPAEIVRQSEADRTGADDENLRGQQDCVSPISPARPRESGNLIA